MYGQLDSVTVYGRALGAGDREQATDETLCMVCIMETLRKICMGSRTPTQLGSGASDLTDNLRTNGSCL